MLPHIVLVVLVVSFTKVAHFFRVGYPALFQDEMRSQIHTPAALSTENILPPPPVLLPG
jgi:hypothetical protein